MTGRPEVEAPSGRFGPQTAHVEAFISAIRDLTDAEAENINRAWYAERSDAWYDAWYDARYAARYAAWSAERSAERSAAWYAAWYAARYAARDTAQALVVADLVGQYGLTREHLDTLVGPCRTVPRLAAIIDAALADTGEVAS